MYAWPLRFGGRPGKLARDRIDGAAPGLTPGKAVGQIRHISVGVTGRCRKCYLHAFVGCLVGDIDDLWRLV